MKFLTIAATALFAAPAFAGQVHGLEDRMMMQCPQINSLNFSGKTLTYALKRGESKREAEICLNLAYADVLGNTFPVNSQASQATRVTKLPNGHIRLD